MSSRSKDTIALVAADSDAHLLRLLEDWDPEKRPLHCSNCLNARVEPYIYGPLARCRIGEHKGRPIALHSLVRRIPRSFKALGKCEGYEAAEYPAEVAQ